jgi:secernin
MASDTVVALGKATDDGSTLFGHNCTRGARQALALIRTPRCTFATGEMLPAKFLQLSQVRETFAVLALQPPGHWGYECGLNERQVAIGCIDLAPSRITQESPGPEFVRAALERCPGARQAVDFITDLLDRRRSERQAGAIDHVFTIADAHEAYVIETAGSHWACQEVREVRAAGSARLIRQDWDRVSRGLADQAIREGRWQADGSKVDFGMTLPGDPFNRTDAFRRWSRALLLLQEQNGSIDQAHIRRVLSDHGAAGVRRPGALCRHGATAGEETTVACFVACLRPAETSLPMAWCAFGPPCRSVFFSVFLDGQMPEAFANGSMLSSEASAREDIARLQDSIDQKTAEFLNDARRLREQGNADELFRMATTFVQHQLEECDALAADSARRAELRGPFALRRPAEQQAATDPAITGYFG